MGLVGPRAAAEVVVIDPTEGRPAGMISGRLLPPGSKDGIVDSGNQLSLSQRDSALRTIQKAATAKLGVVLVILEEAPSLPPMKFGNEITRRWAQAEAEVNLLVLSYPRDPSIPWIFVLSGTQDAEFPQRVSGIAAKAMANAGPASDRIRHAVHVLDLMSEGIVRDMRSLEESGEVIVPTFLEETMEAAPPKGMQEGGVTTGWNLLKPKIPFAWIFWTLGLATGGLVLWFVVRAVMTFVRFRPKTFPRVEYRERFNAPFSGGNNARIFFSKSGPAP